MQATTIIVRDITPAEPHVIGSNPGAIIARFVHTTDAQAFAVATTSNPEDGRVLYITDRAGYIAITVADGIAKGL